MSADRNNDANNATSATKNNDAHERARQLIALAGTEELTGADNSSFDAKSSNAWLAEHLRTCASCRGFAENAGETIRGLRAIPIAAGRSLVSATQASVRRRALELQRQRERLWLVSVSCTAVTVCALLSTVALWRGFEWLGAQAGLAPMIWQIGFVVFCVTPALVAGVLLLLRGTHLADHSGSYQG
jgi:predicted anti-sigma-YlaC factor YlaD